jgi:hypothetical protein
MWIVGFNYYLQLKYKKEVRKITATFALLFAGLMVTAQDSAVTIRRHELGTDITNTLTFLKKNYQSYLLNYRYFFKQNKFAVRAGLNLDISDGNSEGIYPAIKLGLQKNNFDNKWNTYYGADLSFSYYKSNATPTTTTQYGITPMVGVQFFANKRISVSTEAGMNFNHFRIKSKNSFDPIDNTSYNRVNIAYVGMFLISYHF